MDSPKKQPDMAESVKPTMRKRSVNFWGVKTNDDSAKRVKSTLNGPLTTIDKLSVGRSKAPLQFRCIRRSFYKQLKNGGLISFHVMDGSSEISVVAYGSAAEKVDRMVQINGVYQVEDYGISLLRNPKYGIGPSGLEIVLDNKSQIVEDAESNLPSIPLNFITLEDVEKLPLEEHFDCLVVLSEKEPMEVTKNGYKKRDVWVTDKTKIELVLVLLGEEAENSNSAIGTVFAIRKGKMTEFQGTVNMTLGLDGLFWENPDLPITADLKAWFDAEKANVQPSQ